MTTKYLRDAAIFFLLLTYSKTIFSLLAEETTPHYHTTSVSLRFYATGSFHITIGNTLSLSKSTAGRAARLVTELVCSMTKRFICLQERNLWKSWRRSTRLPGRKLSVYLTMTLNFRCILSPTLFNIFEDKKLTNCV